MADTIRIEIPVEMTDKTEPAASNVTSKINKLGDTVKKNSQTVSQFDRQTQKTEKTLQSWARQKYQAVLEAKDKVSPILSSIGGNLKSFAGKTFNTALSVVDMATKPIQGIISLLKNPILQAGAVLGISVSTKDIVDTYKDFESQMSQVRAISGADNGAMNKLTEKAKEMGASTKFTAAEAAQGFNYMAMAGWNTDQMEKGIGGILSLAAASGEDLGKTSDIVTDALTAFNMSADDATHFADVLAVASSNANTNVGMMGETFKYVGAASGALGYSIEDVALGIGLMANAGIKSSQAGTELNSIFTRLSTNTSGARDAIEALGISFYDEKGNARDFGKVLEELRASTKGMNNEQKINLANTIAGQRAQAGLLAMLNASEADYRKVTAAIQDADGAAEKMADTMMDNLQGSITKLQSAWDGLKIKLGERISPYIREFADWLTSKTPAIADAIVTVMDKVDRFADKLRQRWSDLTGSAEWADAGALGKIKLIWDKMIIDPLMEWWNGEGKAKVHHFASEFGNFLGSALNMGIMGLLGFDTGGVLDEGASVGKSFAKGFSEGFDFKAVASKVMEGIGNVFKSALKLLPGGEKGGLSSILSAALIGGTALRIASPVASLAKAGIGVGKLVKTVFGAGTTAAGMAGMAGTVGQAATVLPNGVIAAPGATGGLGLGGKIVSGLSVLGTKAYGVLSGGSGALSGGAASATGLLSIAGGVIGGASVVSGGMDVYRAIKADDEKAKAAYAKSAGWKIGGVAAGAGAGALTGMATGAFAGPIGALIGAGIGGIVGLVMGEREKKKYEEEMARLEERRNKLVEVYKVTGSSLDSITFKSNELNEALQDSEVTAEEFGYMFQSAVAARAKKAFGDIKLSLAEVKDLANSIMYGDKLVDYQAYEKAAAETEAAYESYLSSHSAMDEQTWKVSLGMKLSDSDVDTFRASIDNFVEDAKNYVEKSHYETTIAAKVLLGKNVDTSLIDEFYTGVYGELDAKLEELDKTIEIALEGDYTIDSNEEDAIRKIEEEITNITNAAAEAEHRAAVIGITAKYEVNRLDYDSYKMFEEQLIEDKNTKDEEDYQTYVKIQTFVEYELSKTDDPVKIEKLNSLAEDALKNYKLNLKLNEENFSTDFISGIVGAWGPELDEALSMFEGTTQEKLLTALNGAFAINSSVDTWTSDNIKEWFNLQNLDEEAFAALEPAIKGLASGIANKTVETTDNELKGSAAQLEESFRGFMTPAGDIIADEIYNEEILNKVKDKAIEMSDGVATYFGEGFSPTELEKKMAETISSNVNPDESALNEALGMLVKGNLAGFEVEQYIEPLKDKFEELGISIPDHLKEALNTNFENADIFETLGQLIIADAQGVDVGEYLEPFLTKLKEEDIDLSELGNNLTGSLQEQFKLTADSLNSDELAAGVQAAGESGITTGFSAIGYHELTSGYGTNITDGAASSITNAPIDNIRSAANTKRMEMDGAVRSQLEQEIRVTVPVVANVAWQVMNAAATLTLGGAASGAASVFASLSTHASGGYVSGGPQLSWLAEEGWGEYIIPTNPSRRDRAIDLWQDAGKALGVGAHAEGGYVASAFNAYSNDDSDSGETYSPDTGSKSSSNANVTVNMSMTPEININGASDAGTILDALRGELATMSNEMAATLAEQLKEVLSNTPHRKGAA